MKAIVLSMLCVHWIINQGALTQLVRTFGSQRVENVFSGRCTYAVGRLAHRYGGWGMTPAASVTDSRQVAAAARRVRVVLYDPEDWQFTPPAQQRDPVRAIRQAAEIAQGEGARLIATPGVDLMRILDPGRPRYQAFLQAHIIGRAARYADAVEIQAQSAETNLSLFTSFVRRAAAQARAANPRVIVLAGISTNPSGRHVSAEQLAAAARSVQGIVDGYWLNVPTAGSHCPKCGRPQPQAAGKLLQMFRRHSISGD